MGARLILLESQVGFIAPFGGYFRKNEPYVEIQAADNIILKFEESRKFLASLAIDGEIIPTPGYSDDSITLILDEGLAFTGDLQPIFTLPEDDRTSRESWDRINRHKVSWIYPGHGR
jgi:ribonuclease/clavin/mitogillin